MAKKRFYAVAKGRQIGIFTEWDQVKPLVDKYQGAIYKGFYWREEAERFLKTPSYGKPKKKRISKPKEFKYPPNRGPKQTNPLCRQSFYSGDKPPWEFPDYVDCIETVQQDVIDRLDLSESVACWFR